MHTGMLWFDNSQSTFEVKLQSAIKYYEKKYGRTPNLCFAHPSMLEGQAITGTAIKTIRPYRPVLPGHIWVGIADDEPAAPPAAGE